MRSRATHGLVRHGLQTSDDRCPVTPRHVQINGRRFGESLHTGLKASGSDAVVIHVVVQMHLRGLYKDNT